MSRLVRLKSDCKNNDVFRREKERNDTRKRASPYPIGFRMHDSDLSVPFVKMQNSITGASLVNMPPGVWSISFGWKMGAVSRKGDGANCNVVYGLSREAGKYDLVEVNALYNIFYDDESTYQSYYQNTVRLFTTATSLFLNARLDNAGSDVGTVMSNSYITATLISYYLD
jgi:hypothetical protein